MFESYGLNNLYFGTVIEIKPFIIETINGNTSIKYTELRRYNTILFSGQFNYSDINHDGKIVFWSMDDVDSKVIDMHKSILVADPSTIRALDKEEKVLKKKYKSLIRLPFGKYAYSKTNGNY